MSISPDRTNTGRLNGRWRVDVVVGGKRIQRRVPTHQEALALEASLLQGIEPLKSLPASKGETLGWLLSQRRYIWSGLKDDQSEARLELCVELLGPNMLITDVTRRTLLDLQSKLLSHKPKRKSDRRISSPQTLHRYMSAMSRALTWCEEEEILARTPRIPWPTKTEPVKRPYTPEEEDKVVHWFIDKGWADHATIVRVLSYTGLRSVNCGNLDRNT